MKKIINIIVILIFVSFLFIIGVKAASILSASQISYKNTTVQAAVDELVDIVKQCPDNGLCSRVKIGDYVKMVPTSTSYSTNTTFTAHTTIQTIKPQELNLWRVIKINYDGTIEMVSEYVSSVAIYFNAQPGYRNIVGYLNVLASQYGNSKYTKATRHMGYNGQTQFLSSNNNSIDSTQTTPPWTSITGSNTVESEGGGDWLYEEDMDLVENALGTLIASTPEGTITAYAIAGRYYHYDTSTHWFYALPYITEEGALNACIVRYFWEGSFNTGPSPHSIRPIVTLKSNITSFSGAGTSASPWELS